MRLSGEQWVRIRELRDAGASVRVIAAEVGTSKDSVARAVRRLSDAFREAETPGVQDVWRTWPGPVDASTVWRRERLADGSLVWVRGVWLWGRWVWVDERAWVLCGWCRELVDVVVLGTPGNGHGVSPWPSSREGQLLPMGEDASVQVGVWASEGAPW